MNNAGQTRSQSLARAEGCGSGLLTRLRPAAIMGRHQLCVELHPGVQPTSIHERVLVADPDYIDVPVEGLISKEYARERAKLINPERAASNVQPGHPWDYQERQQQAATTRAGVTQEQEDTTCFVVADRWGNAVCQLQSIQSAWGSSLIAGDTGILLNNRMTYWHLEEDHVDCLQPGKRVRHTMNPVMVFRETGLPDQRGENGGSSQPNGASRQLALICGTPGADTQVQTNLQVLSHVLDFGMTVAEAVEAPRWRNTQSPTESNIPHVCKDELIMEGRFSEDTMNGLRRRGHDLNILEPYDGVTGREMMIQVDADSGVLQGAADPRYDGYAIGW